MCIFYKFKVCGNPVPSKSIHFANSICSLCVSVASFHNYHNISNFPIIIFCGDLWSVVLDITIEKDYDSLKAEMMVNLFEQ